MSSNSFSFNLSSKKFASLTWKLRASVTLRFFILSSIAFSSNQAWSQGGYLGVKGGYQISSLNAENESDINVTNRNTYSLALTYTYFHDQVPLGFSIEPGYTLKGAKIDHDTLDYKLHYLSLPILFDFYPVKKIKVSIGPEVSYLLGAKNVSSDSTSISILDTYNKRWELSGTVGISCSVAFFLDVGFRYNKSFTPVSDYDAVLDRRKLYNSYLQFFVLFKIAN